MASICSDWAYNNFYNNEKKCKTITKRSHSFALISTEIFARGKKEYTTHAEIW